MLNLKDATLFRQQCYIDGQWLNADQGETLSIHNPATGEVLGTIPKMLAAETARAIAAANAAWPAWRAKTAAERGKLLRRWYELILANQDDLALIMTSEQGKPLAEAKGEIGYAASYLEWFAEEGKRAYGEIIPANGTDRRLLVMREPVGVCAAITPWNFPSAMITRKAGAALAAGCTMVLKPASQTPFSALALAELAERAGIPAGVFNVVTGSAKARAENGVWLAGLSTMVQPAASAAPALRVIIADGKFHGVIAAQTPTGSRITSRRRSVPLVGMISP